MADAITPSEALAQSFRALACRLDAILTALQTCCDQLPRAAPGSGGGPTVTLPAPISLSWYSRVTTLRLTPGPVIPGNGSRRGLVFPTSGTGTPFLWPAMNDFFNLRGWRFYTSNPTPIVLVDWLHGNLPAQEWWGTSNGANADFIYMEGM